MFYFFIITFIFLIYLIFKKKNYFFQKNKTFLNLFFNKINKNKITINSYILKKNKIIIFKKFKDDFLFYKIFKLNLLKNNLKIKILCLNSVKFYKFNVSKW